MEEFRFNKNQKLQCTLNGDYTDNSYDRSYLENKFISHSNVQEEMIHAFSFGEILCQV